MDECLHVLSFLYIRKHWRILQWMNEELLQTYEHFLRLSVAMNRSKRQKEYDSSQILYLKRLRDFTAHKRR